MSELKDSFKRLFIFYGRSEAEAERLAELAAEPPLGYRKAYAVKVTKPKSQLSRAEVDRRFLEVKRGGGADDGESVELREDTGCIVAIGGREVAR